MGVLNVIGVASVLLLFLIRMHLSEAGRVLLDEEENWTMKNRLSGLTESKRSPTPPCGHNPGTNIPSPSSPNCHAAASTINQRNFAGHTTTENSTKNRLSGLTESKMSPTPSGGDNPSTNIPSPSSPNGHAAATTINQRNFAGHTTTENSTKNKLFVSMESKQKAAHPPPAGQNGQTNNPGPVPPTTHAASTFNQRNFAGFLRMRTLTSGFHC